MPFPIGSAGEQDTYVNRLRRLLRLVVDGADDRRERTATVLQELAGIRATVFFGTKFLQSIEGVVVDVDAERRSVTLVTDLGERNLLLDEVAAVGDLEGNITERF